MTHPTIENWHRIAKAKDLPGLQALLADEAVFESPVVHTPQRGKAITFKYLAAAFEVLNNDSFTYLNQWYGEKSAVLEFQSVCEGIAINGVDIIEWNADGKIVHFKVMVRPLKAVNKLHELMGRMLQQT
ncbi:MAG TPA: nuclear transport factor 2 family protein [Burkholderiaceae bacterium]|nr:nuclear transport factor 2 family protein [Burkholderiaceae bacterium]